MYSFGLKTYKPVVLVHGILTNCTTISYLAKRIVKYILGTHYSLHQKPIWSLKHLRHREKDWFWSSKNMYNSTASINLIDSGMEQACGYTLHITTPQAAIRVQRVNTRWQDRERNQLYTHRCTERRTEQVRQQRVQCDRLGYNIETHHTANIMDGRQRKVTGQIWFQNMGFSVFPVFSALVMQENP